MTDLLSFTLDAHGGLKNWGKFSSISLSAKIDGKTWERKQQPGILEDVKAFVDTRRQSGVYFPQDDTNSRILYTPNRVAFESASGDIIEELLKPRQSFNGHLRATPWSRLQAFYFAGYAIWTYFNVPFIFASPGYEVDEIEPWQEEGEEWRRLRVRFPDSVATHSSVQTFYIDRTGLIRRHDYNVEISENVASAHYLFNYTDVQGIKIATHRRVYLRKEDNTSLQPEPLLVNIHFGDISID